jgi:acetyl esterase/lipase
MHRAVIVAALSIAVLTVTGCASPALMTVDDLPALAEAQPGLVIPYGKDPLQFGELSLPPGPGPYPVLVWVHGGCWLKPYTISHSRALAQALALDGFAVWNLEYRRVGDPGGGWPGTFQDIGRGTDHLRVLAKSYPLDLSRIVVGGHSAGGELALWLAGRTKVAPSSELYSQDALRPAAVLALAPAADLAALQEKGTCDNVIDVLVGGSPGQYPERYAATEPSRLAPLRLPQTIVVGKHDTDWTWLGEAYVKAARTRGDTQITLIRLPESGHFEMINPRSSSWPIVRKAALKLQSLAH